MWSTRSRASPRARGRLLDVGCGDKPYERLFRPHVREYLGVEHQATFGATAAVSRGEADVLYDGARLPFPDASFDTVLSVQVLEHTPELAVAAGARVLDRALPDPTEALGFTLAARRAPPR
ncbi:uncharacterized protein SOCEGT47_009770 [Sorangium cellulosum]|uniref:Methyltransferase type 11 domain-containing protein n=1 Tax=Sorangium cellulosum TaxID=56 RepID=A0A4P2PUS2_SORCE|nr:methyltransferase domain-containing protein [Sorangium cellulosum]AUX20505.1 uncharacterized protein SOCEGT47_009770 [Sorangium cellulosum]